jgi:hypothetical protein
MKKFGQNFAKILKFAPRPQTPGAPFSQFQVFRLSPIFALPTVDDKFLLLVILKYKFSKKSTQNKLKDKLIIEL